MTTEKNDLLFVWPDDNSPMIFCLRPCSVKAEIKKLILEGGGKCFSHIGQVPVEYNKSEVIHLLPDGETSLEKNTYPTRYIVDCVKEGKMLPATSYHCKLTVQQVDVEIMKKGRMEYSRKEDINILLYVKENKGKATVTGNTFWKKLEKLNTLQLRGRSWHSLKDRYLKHLKGRESEYPLEGRFGPLPMPPIDCQAAEKNAKDSTEIPGSFLAEVEGKRSQLSPGFSQKDYESLIKDFVQTMKKTTNLDSKSIYKALYKCSGSENIAKHFLVNGDCPEGYHMFTDEEDEILITCLNNPSTCDENPARRLSETVGKHAVVRRAAALLGVSKSDFHYMKKIPLRTMQNMDIDECSGISEEDSSEDNATHEH